MIGKEVRLKRLFRNRRLLLVPLDHGMTIGPVQGLQDISQTIEQVYQGGADAVVIHKGLVRLAAPPLTSGNCDFILNLSASTALAPDPNEKRLVSSVEYALRVGATAVSVHINLASRREAFMLKDLGRVAEACDIWGMPLLAMMYVRDGTRQSEYDPVKIKHAARVAEEAGADIINVNYTGSPENFQEVVGSVRLPVIIAGGPKLDSTRKLLEMVAHSAASGAQGIAVGPNIIQHAKPELLCRMIRKLLDDPKPLELLPTVIDEAASLLDRR